MTIYNISIITSTGYPYFYKEIKKLPIGIKLFQKFFDFTENVNRNMEPLDPISHFELNAGLISALFEFAKNLEKKIRNIEFKSLELTLNDDDSKKKIYEGDALICLQSETYLLHQSLKSKINLIYNVIILKKIPLESAPKITEAEENKIFDILTDADARDRIIINESKLNELAKGFFDEMEHYGLNNIVITSFDLSPIKIFGKKFTSNEIEIILRNLGEIPEVDPLEWKFRQSFYNENQVWVYLINSGVGVTVDNLFEPYFYLLITDSQSYLGEFPGKLAHKLNFILG